MTNEYCIDQFDLDILGQLSTPLRYVGDVSDLKIIEEPKLGDICVVNGEREFIYTCSWEEFGCIAQRTTRKISYNKNYCECCGAPLPTLLGDEVTCEYCKAIYT